MKKRTYIGEMEWALNQAYSREYDTNPNRYVQVKGALEYGIEVAHKRRSKEPLPPRPDLDGLF